ncbi:hypothetical protein F4X86_04405 [Candidatus Saccharibacteria bacterium]|nr:hypothetical protein [Candidatus Saccharibacteria bacterium]
MSATVGILAYGSLLSHPGKEIRNARIDTIGKVETPFCVEFARSSQGRGGAPTLVPVKDGGAAVIGSIYVLNVPPHEGANILYRREINKVGSKKRYDASAATKPNSVKVCCRRKLSGVNIVLYAKLKANIDSLTPESLARLAIRSVTSADNGRDGISYLIDARQHGIKTPLSDLYEAEILRQSGCDSLEEALRSYRDAVIR